mgnify:FL=1|tara:strand:+ start:2478 stop:2669 length:192 start_codon:yes stop_codon:yes gene_type:complete
MSTISELRAEAQAKGQELVKKWNELQAESKQIEKQVDSLNGEINGYNKIEPPTQDAPNEAPTD